MGEYSKEYTTIHKLYIKLDQIGYFEKIRSEVKQWLANERENRENSLTTSELISLLDLGKLLELRNHIDQSVDFIQSCSFKLKLDDIRSSQNEVRLIFNEIELKTISEFYRYKEIIDTKLREVDSKMKAIYTLKPFDEVLNTISEIEFRGSIHKDLNPLKNRIYELRYLSPQNPIIIKLLQYILTGISSLELLKRDRLIYETQSTNSSYLNKYKVMEESIIENLRELKNHNRTV